MDQHLIACTTPAEAPSWVPRSHIRRLTMSYNSSSSPPSDICIHTGTQTCIHAHTCMHADTYTDISDMHTDIHMHAHACNTYTQTHACTHMHA